MGVIVGIDPGLEGAYALFDVDSGYIQLGDLPTSGDKTKRQIEGAILRDILTCHQVEAVIVELVGAMPKQGISSTFRFGQATGEVLGVVKGMRLPLWRVTPQAWKKHFGLIGKEKEDGRQLAIHRFPKAASMMARKMDHGRADALLIAAHHIETEMRLAA